MSTETAMWVLGAVLGPMVGWSIHMTILMAKTREDLTELVNMHRKPDEYGFGTTRTNKIIEDNTRAMQALTHYIQWLVKDKTGSVPPPPLGDVNQRNGV